MLHLDTSLFPSTGWLNREVAAFPLCLAAASQSRALKGIISVSFTSPQSFLGYKMIVQRNAVLFFFDARGIKHKWVYSVGVDI